MSDDLRNQIYDNMNLKSTDDLVEIWLKNDRNEWTDVAFNIIEEIILKRTGELPSREEYTLEENLRIEKEKTLIFQAEIENKAVFYEPKEVLQLERWMYRIALYAIVVTAIANLLKLPEIYTTLMNYFVSNEGTMILIWFLSIGLCVILLPIQCLLIYFPLKAFAYILKILMAMEFKSRGADISLLPVLTPDNFDKRYPFLSKPFPPGRFLF